MQQTSPKEPKICLPGKFDGNRSQFRGCLNQVHLVIHMHPSRYPTDATQVGLVGTLLTGTALAWFAPQLEKCCHKRPLLLILYPKCEHTVKFGLKYI